MGTGNWQTMQVPGAPLLHRGWQLGRAVGVGASKEQKGRPHLGRRVGEASVETCEDRLK